MTLKISYAVMGVVLVVALVIGTRPIHTPTADDRAQALEETIKCPVCRGQLVAESDSDASKAIRIDVTRRIAAGESDQQIRAYYAQTLGEDILLKPRATGWGGLIWVLPVVAFVAAAAGIGFGVLALASMGVTERSEVTAAKRRRVVRLNPDDLAALEEERRFLQRSLTDLEREHEFGDVGDGDFATLQADYQMRLTRVTHDIEAGKIEIAATPRRSRARTTLIVAGVVVFALLSGAAVAELAGRRDTGQEISGDITKTARERNTECLTMARDHPADAVTCYDAVLKDAPQNVEALTYRGWIRYTVSDPAGLNDLFTAVKLDGTYPDVHAFLAVVLYQSGCAADAKSELDVLNTLNPSPLIQQQVAGLSDQINQELATPSTTGSTCPAAP